MTMNPVQPGEKPRTFWQRLRRAFVGWVIGSSIWFAIGLGLIFAEPLRALLPVPVWIIFVLPVLFWPYFLLELLFTFLFLELTDDGTKSGNPPDDPSKAAQDALARNLAKEGVAKPRAPPNPDTAHREG